MQVEQLQFSNLGSMFFSFRESLIIYENKDQRKANTIKCRLGGKVSNYMTQYDTRPDNLINWASFRWFFEKYHGKSDVFLCWIK
jgi:hypothetical protein